jgi:hypothetical protein
VPDVVTIHYAAHFLAAGYLKVLATSDNGGAILDVFDHTLNVYIGTLPTGGGSGLFIYPPYPPQVRVQSSLGGTATAAVISFP